MSVPIEHGWPQQVVSHHTPHQPADAGYPPRPMTARVADVQVGAKTTVWVEALDGLGQRVALLDPIEAQQLAEQLIGGAVDANRRRQQLNATEPGS